MQGGPGMMMSGSNAGGAGAMMSGANGGGGMMMSSHSADQMPGSLPIEGQLPSLSGALAGAVTWLNSPPLSADDLRGKVVLIDFWTYSCINCLRSIPYVRAWAEKYKAQGLVVIGVHAPEFAFEKNVRQRAPRHPGFENHLSGRDRQQLCDLACLQ